MIAVCVSPTGSPSLEIDGDDEVIFQDGANMKASFSLVLGKWKR